MLFKYFAMLWAVRSTLAQRPSSTSICDYYTSALLKENTGTNQYMVLTLVVNTALIGNYTQPNVGISVPGILNKGEYGGEAIDLLPYFDGGLVSTNNNNMSSVMSFLDGGGAVPLMQNKPANDTTSNQYMLLTHLYEYFGVLLGCTQVGKSGFPPYGGDPSMYDVHKFMALSENQIGYFITQVGLAATSLGVSTSDAAAVGASLTKLFNYKCIAPEIVVPDQGPQLNSICLAESCPLAPMNATCGLYDNMNGTSPQPATASSSLSMSSTPAISSSVEAPSAAPAMTKTTTVTTTVTQCPSCSCAPSGMASTMPESQTPKSIMPSTMSNMASPASPSSSSACTTNLSGAYQFPHLIVPISSTHATTAYGTSYDVTIDSTTSTIFNFDIPSSYAGSQCSLIFLFPLQSQLQTSSFTFSGNGALDFMSLSSPATQETTYENAPSVKQNVATIQVTPGNSYVLNSRYPCPAGQRIAVEAKAQGQTALTFMEDYNESPIGLFITKCEG